jgi:hypothetical protein
LQPCRSGSAPPNQARLRKHLCIIPPGRGAESQDTPRRSSIEAYPPLFVASLAPAWPSDGGAGRWPLDLTISGKGITQKQRVQLWNHAVSSLNCKTTPQILFASTEEHSGSEPSFIYFSSVLLYLLRAIGTSDLSTSL